MPTVQEIVDVLFAWAPAALAWEKDNVGILTGDAGAECTGILVSLDVTREVIAEAVSRGANVVVAHHPVIYRPLSSIRDDAEQGRLIGDILRNHLTVVAMHTNADAAATGVNTCLAETLGLRDTEPLGAAQPGAAAGEGLGTLGLLPQPMLIRDFVAHVKRTLGCTAVRASRHDADATIHRVAVCGGAGGSLLETAARRGAHAFVTADLNYHAFLDYGRRLLVLDAGHYETEFPFINRCVEVLRAGLFDKMEKSRIFPALTMTNGMCTV